MLFVNILKVNFDDPFVKNTKLIKYKKTEKFLDKINKNVISTKFCAVSILSRRRRFFEVGKIYHSIIFLGVRDHF